MEGEVHVVAGSVGRRQRVEPGVLPQVALRVAVFEHGLEQMNLIRKEQIERKYSLR